MAKTFTIVTPRMLRFKSVRAEREKRLEERGRNVHTVANWTAQSPVLVFLSFCAENKNEILLKTGKRR